MIVLFAIVIVVGANWVPPKYNETVWMAFRSKHLLNPMKPLAGNPYHEKGFNTTWVDHVCAARYPNPGDVTNYELRTYATKTAAEAAGAAVTHLHPCGYCSTAQDLSVYMQYPDLTDPVRRCGMLTIVSIDLAVDCIVDIGFSHGCAVIWALDAANTREHCWKPCIEDWIEGTPNNVPPDSVFLNPCLACDEAVSGPIFKVVAGRTRRDSGLISSINRPNNEIYHVVQDWWNGVR